MPSEDRIKGIMEFVKGFKDIDIQAVGDGLECWKLHRQVEQAFEDDIARWGLTPRQIEILEVLYFEPAGTATPAELSDEVNLTRSAMTSALDSLEQPGHIVRGPHPSDRRRIAISLTSSGREFIAQRLPERYRRMATVIGQISRKERQLLIQVYSKILDIFTDDSSGEEK